MRRLLLPTLLGVFCLVLLALPAHAGLYDPRTPPPTPSITIGGDLNAGEASWGEAGQVRKVLYPNGSNTAEEHISPDRDNAQLDNLNFWQRFTDYLRRALGRPHYRQGEAGHE